MKHSKIASIGDKNIALCHNNNTPSAKVSMPHVEALMEVPCQPMDMEEDDVFDDAVKVPLRTLTHVDTPVVSQQVLSAVPVVVVKPSGEGVHVRKSRAPCRWYSTHRVMQLS